MDCTRTVPAVRLAMPAKLVLPDISTRQMRVLVEGSVPRVYVGVDDAAATRADEEIVDFVKMH